MAGSVDDSDEQVLLDAVHQSFLAGLVELHTYQPRMTTLAGPRPQASPLARLEARSGSTVTTLLHSSVQLEDEAARYALQLMDGSRDRDALCAALDEWARASDLQQIEQPALSQAMERNLASLARLGLMLA